VQELADEQRVASIPLVCNMTPPEAGTHINDRVTITFPGTERTAVSIPVLGRTAHPAYEVAPGAVNFGGIAEGGSTVQISVKPRSKHHLPKLTARPVDPASGVRVRVVPEADGTKGLVVIIEAIPGERAFLDGVVRLEDPDSGTPPYLLHYTGYVVGR